MFFYVRIVDPNHVCKFEEIKTWHDGKRVKSSLGQCGCGIIGKVE